MIFDFDPWKLDIDVNLTKQLYQEVDYSTDIAANKEFINSLSLKQQRFFTSLGVDLTKIDVDRMIYQVPEEENIPSFKIYRMTINFMIKGKILQLPQYQKDLYSDPDIFGTHFPKSIQVSTSKKDYFSTFNNGIGLDIVFKHPYFHFDDAIFKKWDCGYILGTILIMIND